MRNDKSNLDMINRILKDIKWHKVNFKVEKN